MFIIEMTFPFSVSLRNVFKMSFLNGSPTLLWDHYFALTLLEFQRGDAANTHFQLTPFHSASLISIVSPHPYSQWQVN